jgi:hypothetical protein
MRKFYEEPVLQIRNLGNEDIITQSGGNGENDGPVFGGNDWGLGEMPIE